MASDLEERVRAAVRDKLLMMKIPERENDFLPSSCCLLEKQRELAEVEKSFLATKEENDAKRNRAMRKAEQEKQQVAEKEVEAEHLKQELARLMTAKTKLQQRLAARKPFSEYLQKVLGKTEQFQEISELIGRFQTLMATQASLVQREQAAREAVEEERRCLQQYMDESSNRILQQNNLESNWICIQNTAADKTLELGQIKLAALNLFQMVAKHRKLPMNVPQEDTEAQLDVVSSNTTSLNAVHFGKATPWEAFND
ncbi:hypothetical protein Chor_013044 [Crotalus horridus]